VVLRKAGEPLRVEEILIDAPTGREVLVEVAYSGVCGSDHHVLTGAAGVPLPMVLGHEGAGIVAAVGDAVTTVAPGDHVVLSWTPQCGTCRPCQTGRPQLCEVAVATAYGDGVLPHGEFRLHDHDGHRLGALLGTGTFAEYALVHETAAIAIDPEVPLDRAAIVGCAVATGAGAVMNTARVPPGATVLVTGCGGVGLSAVQGAALVGAWRIIAADRSEERLEMARRLGATHTLVPAGDDLAEQVRALTGGAGVDYAFEAIGHTGVLEQCVDALAPGGTAVVVGLPSDGARASFDVAMLSMTEKRICGCNYGSTRPAVDFPMLLDLYRAGRFDLDAMVTVVRPLADVGEAFADLEAGRGIRTVLACSGLRP
jgi:S-(hydroxymethyl)glutathione dehydrogenase/alcohol dehydrogenase